MKFLVRKMAKGRVVAAMKSEVPVSESRRFRRTNSEYTGTMTAVIGKPVANRIVYRNGRLNRMLYRERGYAHSVAVITLTSAAPPHNTRPFHIGRYVVSVVRTAWKLDRLGCLGTVSASCAAGFTADSTNHASGAKKATATT